MGYMLRASERIRCHRFNPHRSTDLTAWVKPLYKPVCDVL